MRFPPALLVAACCLALLGCAAAHGSGGGSNNHNLWGLVGKWQGACVTKGYQGGCADDIITYPYYVEYAWDYSYNKYKMWYRQDAVDIDTWPLDHQYSLDSDHGSGYVDVYQNYDGFCVDVEYDGGDPHRSYRVKLKHEGELDIIIEEGEYSQQSPYYGTWHTCPNKSFKSLKCNDYTYTYRCYLVRTNNWSWSWN